MRTVIITSLLVVSLVGCATSTRPAITNTPSAQWKKKNYQVHFYIGHRSASGKSYSYYQIREHERDSSDSGLIMQSEHFSSGIHSTASIARDHIRVIEDRNGVSLLIEESIPNDCEPCSNYLWISKDGDDQNLGTYLRLPLKEIPYCAGETYPAGFTYEYPKVQSLNKEIITYGYSNGVVITESIQSIEKADAPIPPG